jgi:hypothetical protein
MAEVTGSADAGSPSSLTTGFAVPPVTTAAGFFAVSAIAALRAALARSDSLPKTTFR